MKVECFEFKRCCGCIPLRYGLLFWAYLKLAISVLIMVPVLTRSAVTAIARFGYKSLELGIIGLFSIVLLADIALTIVFVVGAHKKCPKLLNVYNYYSIGLLGLLILVNLIQVGPTFFYLVPRYGFINTLLISKGPLCFGFCSVVIQLYLIFLNKAEIAKLEMNSGFTFTNNATEAECKIVEEGIVANGINNDQQNGTNLKNSELEYEDFNENEENRTKKIAGNYVKLV